MVLHRPVECTALIGTWAATEDQELADVCDDESDIVLLRHRGRLPSADLGEQSVHQLKGLAHLGGENNLFKLALAKGLAFCIFGLNHTISVKEKSVAWAEGYVANRIVGLWLHSENQAIAFDALQCSRT